MEQRAEAGTELGAEAGTKAELNAAAEVRSAAEVRADLADPAVGDGSRLFSHGGRTARAVLLLHGYNHAPSQLEPLAREFFARGYNVWVPRAPHHGTSAPGRLEIHGLTAYAERALTLTEELGEEVGVVGVSAGGVLAAWLLRERPDAVRRLLLLAPFFAPARIPAFAVKPLVFLYSRGLLPDRTTSRGYSLRAVTQYLRLAGRLRPKARPVSGAVVFSERDDVVDPAAATRRLAGTHLVTQLLPATVGHNIVDAASPESLRLYADLYEGAVTSVREG